MDLSHLTLQTIGFRVAALLIISAVHGVALAGTAVLLGDRGPKYDGRLTVLPTRHVDGIGGLALILFGLGWPKAVAVDAGALRMGRPGIAVVVLAGVLSLLALAVVLRFLLVPALTTLPDSAALATAAFLRACADLSIWVALLSLVPVPPLAAGLLLPAFGMNVPGKAGWFLAALVLAAVASGLAAQVLGPAHTFLATRLLGG